MDEKELFSKKTFIDLFGMNDIDRLEREDELFIEAKRMGMEKRFKDSLKKYGKLLSDKINIGEKTKLPKCKYNIEDYNFGKYICTGHGIVDSKTDTKFSNIPILPVERYINQETGKEKIKIIYYIEDEWKEKLVDRSQLAISQKLLLLSDDGLDVNSENVRFYINFFSDIMSMNNIKKLEGISRIGWKENKFIPYDTHGIFDGNKEAEALYNAIGSKGNYDLWLKTIKELRQNKTVKVLMASTLASPLIEKLSIQPFIVNLWSSLSGNGKTLLCMVVMSIWGNPDVGALRLSSNSTANYCASLASFLRNITCYFDELQIIKNTKYTSLESLIMDLCNGTERGRLNKNSQLKEVKTWFCNFLFTNNERMVNENAGEQIYNRVIDIEVNQKIFEKPHDTANVIRNNYGFFGKEYIKAIQKIGFEKIDKKFNEVYERIVKETEITDKQANSLVSMIVADEIVVSIFFKDEKPLSIEDVKEYINNKNEIKTSVKAKEYIVGIINANIKRFDENNYGECWGYKDEWHCTINAQILFRELAKGGYEFNTVKQEWANEGFLEKNSQGKFIHQTTVRKEKGNYIRLKLD